MLKRGHMVSIRPEFQDAGDELLTWVVADHEEKGRVDISPTNLNFTIAPDFTLRVNQIKHFESDRTSH